MLNNTFIDRFSEKISGVLEGFDRIVFKGAILPLCHIPGVLSFLARRNLLNKDFKTWTKEQSRSLIGHAEAYVKAERGEEIFGLKSWKIRKEQVAHEHQLNSAIESGLIGIWKCQESGRSYRSDFVKGGNPKLCFYQPPCNHLYFYFDHADYGFMNVRLQTWFPYHIQICMNGREWLRRQLEKEGIGFLRKGNKFLHIDSIPRAQELLNSQLETDWKELLDGFLPVVFPTMKDVLGENLSYYWTLWQSEWASDIIFNTPEDLRFLSGSLIRHAFITNTADQVFRYLDHPLTRAGQPYKSFKGDLISRFNSFQDGVRVRHWINKNSVKMYSEQNCLRIETTINKPGEFKIHRHVQGEPADAPKQLRPMRKGIADITVRTQVSQQINERFAAGLSEAEEKTPFKESLKNVTSSFTVNSRRVRALDITGKDRELLAALADPAFLIQGLTNRMLRNKLKNTLWSKGRTDRQFSARVTRHLKLLRSHGLIRKIPQKRAYHLTSKGRKLTLSLCALLNASTQQLMEMAA